MNKGKLLLTSTGLSSDCVVQELKDIVAKPETQSVAIITTAAEDKENNKYSQLAKKQLIDIGFINIDFIDLEAEPSRNLSKYNIIYVCGGNTFKLLKFSREANFKKSVEDLLNRNGLYIGVSAGSIIVGPSINIAAEVEPDINDVGLTDLTGLGITDLIILPHYSSEIEEETKSFEKKYNVVVERVNNFEAILVQDGKKNIIK